MRKNALSAAVAYYLAAGRRKEEMEEDGPHQDVCVFTPQLVLMARRVDSSASFWQMVGVRCRLNRNDAMPGICIFWGGHWELALL